VVEIKKQYERFMLEDYITVTATILY